jgi:general secretion pathway protein A
VTTPGQPERVEGYEQFFGLNEPPFSLAPDPRFLFASASHSAALAQVAYALERREPLVVITGEIGTGKTLLCRTVLQRLPFKTFLTVIDDPLLERDDLLKQMLQDFGVISKDRTRLIGASRHELVQKLHEFLSSLAKIQAHAVVIIDEAQHLEPDVLEQIRLLSNIDDARGTALQIILVGQTDLEPLLSRPELRQLQQRVSRRLRLEALNRSEVEQYIEHRLALARGGKPSPPAPVATEMAQESGESAGTKPGVRFTPDAIDAVLQLARGVPRVINLLCDRSLEEAYASQLRIIDRPLIQTAALALGVGDHAAPSTTADRNVHASDTEVGPDRPVSTVAPEAEHEIARPAAEAVSGLGAPDQPATASPVRKYAVLAACIVLAGVVIVFGLRAARPPAPAAPSSAASSMPRAAGPRPDPAPAGANASAPKSAATGTSTLQQASGPAPSAAAPTTTSGRFDIVVASFRTEARAASVAADVVALGLPIRRRVLEGWQQVVSGPFASRAQAEDARQRLVRAGLTGTQIVPAPP